jgi:hypothetical protein
VASRTRRRNERVPRIMDDMVPAFDMEWDCLAELVLGFEELEVEDEDGVIARVEVGMMSVVKPGASTEDDSDAVRVPINDTSAVDGDADSKDVRVLSIEVLIDIDSRLANDAMSDENADP